MQVNDVCLRANRKLSVLRSVKFLKRNTLDLLYKITVRSLIDYALPIYSNNLKLTDLARFDRLQYKAATDLQKDYFCPVSQFSTVKCPNHAFGEFCSNMRHKSKLRLVFYSIRVFLS